LAKDDPQRELPKRRKWGWIFVVLFFVQAIGLLLFSGNANQRSFDALMDARAQKQYDASRNLYGAAASLKQQAELAYALIVPGSLICIIGSFLGFRRRK